MNILLEYSKHPRVLAAAGCTVHRRRQTDYPVTSPAIDFDSPHGNDLILLALRGAALELLTECDCYISNCSPFNGFHVVTYEGHTIISRPYADSYDDAILAALEYYK